MTTEEDKTYDSLAAERMRTHGESETTTENLVVFFLLVFGVIGLIFLLR